MGKIRRKTFLNNVVRLKLNFYIKLFSRSIGKKNANYVPSQSFKFLLIILSIFESRKSFRLNLQNLFNHDQLVFEAVLETRVVVVFVKILFCKFFSNYESLKNFLCAYSIVGQCQRSSINFERRR